MQQHPRLPRNRTVERGLSLLELLVGLMIGLFVVGGVGAIYLSVRQTHQVKQQLNDAMEVLRFGSYTLSRLIRQADSVHAVGTDNQGNPYIRLDTVYRGGGVVNASTDCGGSRVSAATGSVVLELKWMRNTRELRCTTLTMTDTGQLTGAAQTLLHPLSHLAFACKKADAHGGLLLADCGVATAVQVRLGVQKHPASASLVQTFTVTLRMPAMRHGAVF